MSAMREAINKALKYYNRTEGEAYEEGWQACLQHIRTKGAVGKVSDAGFGLGAVGFLTVPLQIGTTLYKLEDES